MTEVKPLTEATEIVTKLQPNIALLLCYLFGWASGIVFLFYAKKDKVIRFNAWQSIIIFGILSVAVVILNLVPPIGGILHWVLFVLYWIVVTLSLVLWLFLMGKGYQGQAYRLPVAGDLAQRLQSYEPKKYGEKKEFKQHGSSVSKGAFTKVIRDWGAIQSLEKRFRYPTGFWKILGKDVLNNPRGAVAVNDVQGIVEHRQVKETLDQNYDNIKVTLNGTIRAMALTVELRDPYTAGHQQRVALLACAIAKEMGLPEEQINGLRMAAVIHDIGKMNVPAEILSKPGKLTEMEFGIVKTHSQAGYEILKTIEFPYPVAQIVLQHHERMDGSGYPLGLRGKDILLEVRILGVADVVEAMASHRPYRPALGMDKALEEVSRKKGICYDADVVDACQRLLTEKGFRFE